MFSCSGYGIEIDFAGLIQKFCYEQCCVVMKTPPELLHVFEEICDCTYRGNLGYLRLKALEIFFLLSNLSTQDNIETSAYYSGETIAKVKALKSALMEQLDRKFLCQNLPSNTD